MISDFTLLFRPPAVAPDEHVANLALVRRLRRRFPRVEFLIAGFDYGHAVGISAARGEGDEQRRTAVRCAGAVLPVSAVDTLSRGVLQHLYPGTYLAP